MRPRMVGKIVLIVATIGFAIAAFTQAVITNERKAYRGKRAISLAILSLVSATSIRYFED